LVPPGRAGRAGGAGRLGIKGTGRPVTGGAGGARVTTDDLKAGVGADDPLTDPHSILALAGDCKGACWSTILQTFK